MSRLIGTLLLAAIAIAALGFYLGWFEISRQNKGKETTVSLKINRDKLQHDTEKAAEKTKEFGQKVAQQGKEAFQATKDKLQELSARQTTHGSLKEINVEQSKFTLASDEGKLMPIQVTDKTTIEREGVRISLNDLVVGQTVTVVYSTQENQRIAESVRVATK